MQILINNTQVEAVSGETLLKVARRAGFDIPSLCYSEGVKHRPSCMVCGVKDCSSGQIIPSCATLVVDGMEVDADSDEVKYIRSLSLELLLSDHRADCDAPCSMVCPQGLDIEQMLDLYDSNKNEEAHALIVTTLIQGCDDCKAPCEKVCRRKSVDKEVSIREIINKLTDKYGKPAVTDTKKEKSKSDSILFQSRLGRYTTHEKEWLKKNTSTVSGCLHCACSERIDCKLRLYATAAGIKRSRYNASSALSLTQKQHVTGKLWFEPAKCIRCGLCVYNSNNGFTFQNRGFSMQVAIPEENKANVNEELSELCPTGALSNRLSLYN